MRVPRGDRIDSPRRSRVCSPLTLQLPRATRRGDATPKGMVGRMDILNSRLSASLALGVVSLSALTLASKASGQEGAVSRLPTPSVAEMVSASEVLNGDYFVGPDRAAEYTLISSGAPLSTSMSSPQRADLGAERIVEEVRFDRPCGVMCDPCVTPEVCCLPPPCCAPTFWYGGVEATFFGVDHNGSGVGGRVQDTIATPNVDASWGTGATGLDDFYVAPRVLLGVQHGCWGVQGRYWHLRANESAYDPFVFAPGSFEGLQDVGYSVFNQLDAYTVDLEGTYSFCAYDSKNTLSLGARYASATHTAGLDSFADVNDGASGQGLLASRAWSQASAQGTGITASWIGRKPLFCRSCVHLIGGLRGSALWGSTNATAETSVAAQTTSGGGSASTNAARVGSNDTLFIGEVFSGLQWDYRVHCFPADAFFRIVAEYQYWNSDGGAAAAGSFAGFGTAPNFAQGTATASASALQMDLYGLSIGTGFTW